MHTFQRTLYDCMDEAEFPVGSVDTANAWSFFDTTAVAETGEVTQYSFHRTPYWRYPSLFPTEDCMTTLEAAIGTEDVEQVYVHLPWSDEIADLVRTHSTSCTVASLVHPDLTPDLDDSQLTLR